MKKHKGHMPPETAVDQMRRELKRVRYRREYWRALRSTLFSLLLIAALILSVAAYLPIVRITGDSMADTLRRGDILLTLRGDDVRRGDLVVFYVEGGKMLVKRVAAVDGDQVQMDQDGVLVVNGETVSETYVTNSSLGECDLEFPIIVPRERIFVLGDNRELSIDSRSSAMGYIAREQIIGKVALRIWPIQTFGRIGSAKCTEG